MMGNGDDALVALTRETQQIWDGKAAFWDEQMGEGNAFHRVLVGPSVERLLAPQAGELILDIACGNGQFARRLAALGTSVVATISARCSSNGRGRARRRSPTGSTIASSMRPTRRRCWRSVPGNSTGQSATWR